MRLIFAWYDFWVGFYYDRNKKYLYIFPVPMIGLRVDMREYMESPKHVKNNF